MRVVFFGSGDFGIPCLEALRGSESTELVHIFTQPARPAGRSKQITPTWVANWAKEKTHPCTEAKNINSKDMLEKVSACRGDLLVVIAFGQKISNEVIKKFPQGAINVHASLLPKYRGAAPINWAVINNETETGISIITVAEKMDAGLVLGQSKISILTVDTAQTVQNKLMEIAPDILMETIAGIADGSVVYTQQDESLVTFAPKLKKSDGFINWSDPAETIRNKIRGLWSWPGAKADYVSAKTTKCYRVTIAEAQVVTTSGDPGAFGLLDQNMNVVCGKDRLKILQLKPAGGKLMDFEDFARGRASSSGDLFLPVEEID